MSNQSYKIEMTPDPNQVSNTPTSCSDVSYLLDFALYQKNGSTWSPDPASWYDLQIEAGDEVTWQWEPGNQGSWAPNTSFSFLLLTSIQISEDGGDTWNTLSAESLLDYANIMTGNFKKEKCLPDPASSCPGHGDPTSYLAANSNTITIQGKKISGNFILKIIYTIWFKTSNFNYQQGVDAAWYYDPEVDVKPSKAGGTADS